MLQKAPYWLSYIFLAIWLSALIGCPAKGMINPEATRQYKIGLLYLQQGRYNIAEKYFMRAIDVDKRLATPYDKLGVIQMERGLYRIAESWFRQALKRDNKFVVAWNHLGKSLQSQSRYQAAIAAFQKALSIRPSAFMPRLNLAGTYRRLRQFGKAQKECFRLISENPKRHETHTEVGEIYLAQGDEKGAISSFKRAIRRNKRAKNAYLLLGKLYLKKRKYCLAHQNLYKVLVLDIRHPEARRLYGEAKLGLRGSSCSDQKIK